MRDFKVSAENSDNAIAYMLLDILTRVRNIEAFIYAKETKGDAEQQEKFKETYSKTFKSIQDDLLDELYLEFGKIDIEPDNKTEE